MPRGTAVLPAVEPQYELQLLQLAQQAKVITGYVIQVKEYESQVGSAALNQRLSTERPENVTNFIEQQAQTPLTNILAPGAVGIRILQDKGVVST